MAKRKSVWTSPAPLDHKYRTKHRQRLRPKSMPDDWFNEIITCAAETNGDTDFNNPVFHKHGKKVIVFARNKPADSDRFKWSGIELISYTK